MKKSANVVSIIISIVCALTVFTSCSRPSDSSTHSSSSVSSDSDSFSSQLDSSSLDSSTSSTVSDISQTTRSSGEISKTTGASIVTSTSTSPSKKGSTPYNYIQTSEAMRNKALLNKGENNRITAAMNKAESGNPVTVGFIGGSITEGFFATSENGRYANRIAQWWRDRFPASTVDLINAGIGSTDSVIGVHRAEKDLLKNKPDFVVIEFSVNDWPSDILEEAYEGLVRRILNSANKPGVILLCMTSKDSRTAQELHAKIGKHYKLEIVSYHNVIQDELKANRLKWSDLSGDDVHPNDKGHGIAAELVISALERIYAEKSKAIEVKALPAPITKNRLEKAVIYDNSASGVKAKAGWEAVASPAHKFQNGWKSVEKGKALTIEVEAQVVHILYQRLVRGGAVAQVKVDGKLIANINSDFSGGWDNYPAYQLILDENNKAKHTIEITMMGGVSNDFIMVGLMVA